MATAASTALLEDVEADAGGVPFLSADHGMVGEHRLGPQRWLRVGPRELRAEPMQQCEHKQGT